MSPTDVKTLELMRKLWNCVCVGEESSMSKITEHMVMDCDMKGIYISADAAETK